MADPIALREHLDAYQRGLKDHLTLVEEELSALRASWAQVEDVWSGAAADDLAGFVEGTRRRLDDHLETGRRLAHYLEERIALLDRFTGR